MNSKPNESSLDITVYVRILPFSEGQVKSSFLAISDQADAVSITNPAHRSSETKETFNFERVFYPDASQHEIFQDLEPQILDNLFKGSSVGIFSFGQEGKLYSQNAQVQEKRTQLLARRIGLVKQVASTLGTRRIKGALCSGRVEAFSKRWGKRKKLQLN